MSLAVAIRAHVLPPLRVYSPDPGEWDRAIAGHLGTVERLARRYSRGREVDPDLYQEGCLALVRAAARLDWDAPDFAGRAAEIVREAIRGAAGGTVARVVGLGREARRDRRRLARSRSRLGDRATAREVCDDLQASGARRACLARLLRLVDGGPEGVGVETLGGGDGRAAESRHADLESLSAALAALRPSLREALTLRYGLGGGGPRSVAEAAASVGVGRTTLVKRVRRAIEELGHLMEQHS